MISTMITRHGNNAKEVTGYTLISSHDYSTISVQTEALVKAIQSGKIKVTNLDVENGKLVSTNGAIENYTLISNATGSVVGAARGVILDRIEKDGKLVGYTMFTPNGVLKEISVADAVALCNKKLISNGKIRHTETGDIVSSIGGNYPLREIALANAPSEDFYAKVIYFAKADKLAYAGVMISSDSAAVMTKVRASVEADNAKVIEESNKLGNKHTSSLKIQRAGATTTYAVISLTELDKLVRHKAKLSLLSDKVVVSVVKYGDGSLTEATVTLSSELKTVGSKKSDDEEINSAVKSYAKKVADYIKKNGQN